MGLRIHPPTAATSWMVLVLPRSRNLGTAGGDCLLSRVRVSGLAARSPRSAVSTIEEEHMTKLQTLFGCAIAGSVLATVPIEPSFKAPYGLEVSHADAITYRRARVTYRRAYRRGARAAYYGAGYGAGYYGGYGGYSYPSYGYGSYYSPTSPSYGTYPGYGYGGYGGYWRPYFGRRPGLF